MKRIGIQLFIIAAFTLNTFPGSVSTQRASQVAVNFMSARVAPELFQATTGIEVTETFTVRDQESPLYYVFNLKPEGWIAIAAEDAVFPILAYSFDGRYDETLQAPQFKAWMKQYADQIRYAIRENIAPFPQTVTRWKQLTDPLSQMPDDQTPQIQHPTYGIFTASVEKQRNPEPETRNLKSIIGVEPLITSRWNQSPWYNEMCPADPAGPGEHCVAGCVPVCMAQVMYYFRWPETGTGSYTYTEPNYGVLSADFGATTYVWNEMTNSISRSNPAIAELIYHLGVSCDLQYGPDGSGMYNHKAAYSLRTFFRYSPETQYLFRDSTTLNWDSVLIAHLDLKIPMYYAGWSDPNIIGHAFVCDGYQDSCFFHFNFGWGGSSDGYFYTSDLTPGGNNFNLAQEVVINCFPDTINNIYPVQCAGNLEFTTMLGSFEDGSGPVNNYLPDANCSWLIDPQTVTDSVTDISLDFDRFATNPDDFVSVYDGKTTDDPLLGRFSGDSIPAGITSSGNSMLITFEAGAQPADNGFLAHYKANIPVWCSGTTTIKADSAEISDGSFDFNYYNNSLCKWKVETESGDPLTIYFEYFDTEADHDFLTIYDLGTGDTLVSLSGEYTTGNLPDSVTSPGGQMFLIFITNSTITSDGWKIHYPKKSNISIDDQNGIRDLQLFPNPASDLMNIRFVTIHVSPVQVVISAADGRIVHQSTWQTKAGRNTGEVDVNDFQAGIYLVRLTSEQGTSVKKLIIQ